MNRTQQILLVALVAQIVLSAVVLWPRAATGGVGPLFPGLQPEGIVALTITDDQGETLQLRQVTGEWILPEAGDYPAQTEDITSLLEKIEALTTQRLVTRTEASHKRLKVAADDFLRRVELEAGDGVVRTFYLGSSPSYGTSHIRVDGQAETYLANDLSQWDLNAGPSSWVDITYLNVSQDEVSRVVVENAKGRVEFVKDDQGNWTLADLVVPEQLDVTTINTTVSRATSVTMLRPLGKEELPGYGMESPSAVVTLHKEGETITVLVGAHDAEDNSYVIKASTSPYYVAVGSYSVQPLVDNARQDYLQIPPTPTPAQ